MDATANAANESGVIIFVLSFETAILNLASVISNISSHQDMLCREKRLMLLKVEC